MALKHEVIVGILAILIGLTMLFVWIPLDVESSIVETIRSRTVIGDALAPTVTAILFIVSGTLLVLTSSERASHYRLSAANFLYLLGLVGLVVIVMLLIRWSGPLVVGLLKHFGAEVAGYRALRDSAPWKYIGYLTGGTLLVFILMCFVEHRLRWSRLLIAFLVTLALALVYDLPFEDLLLPPNGDI